MTLGLLPNHLADLEASGLSGSTIERWGPYSIHVNQPWVMQQLGFGHISLPALALPILPPDRAEPDLNDVIIKPDRPRLDERGRPRKYEMRPRSRNRVHAPLSTRNQLGDLSVRLHITEGLKKAEKGAQEGLCCTAIMGVNNWLERVGESSFPSGDFDLIPLQGRGVVLCFDSDAAQNPHVLRAERDIGAFLKRRGAVVFIKRIPPTLNNKKQGLDDFLVAYSVEHFFNLPEEPLNLEPGVETLIAELTPESGKKDRDRVLERIATETDTAERVRLLGLLARRIRIPRKVLEAAPALRASPPAQPKLEQPKMSDEECEKAMSLLRDPELFDRFIKDSADMGIVGEEDNRALLELCYTSRLGHDPVNINAKGESAAGKNHLVCTIAKMHPPEVVKEITYASAKSLLYLKEPLAHKILLIMEAPGAEEAQYSIRTMESEGRIVVLVAERGPDGHIETREHTVEGPIAVVETTTKPHLHPENETRTFDIFVNESSEQTKSILEEQARRAEHPEVTARTAEIARRWQNAHRLLKVYPAVIPYAGTVAKALARRHSLQQLRVRRDFPRVLALIRACALLHQYQRRRESREGVEYVVANEDDYAIVREVAGPALAQAWMEATPRCRRLVEAASRLAGGVGEEEEGAEGNDGISTRKLTKELGWSAPTVRKYAKEAVLLGCLAPTDCPGRWQYVGSVTKVNNPLPTYEDAFGCVSAPS
jgi:uncharacterized protein DUF3854